MNKCRNYLNLRGSNVGASVDETSGAAVLISSFHLNSFECETDTYIERMWVHQEKKIDRKKEKEREWENRERERKGENERER